jgi:flagella basal body P-ring formation protein FlgA
VSGLPQAYAVTQQEVAAACQKAVCQAYQAVAPCGQLSTQLTHQLQPWLADATLTKAEYLNHPQHFSQKGIVRLSLVSAQGQHRQLGLPIDVTWQRPVWVVTQAIEAGQALQPSQVKAETRAMDHQAAHLFAASQPLPFDAWQAVLNLPKGSVLDDRKLKPLPWVRRGQEATLTLTPRPGLSVELKVTALEDGYEGQSIRVRQLRPVKKTHTVIVVGKGQVSPTSS